MSVAAKIERLEALAASTTFAGERDAALAAIDRLRSKGAHEAPRGTTDGRAHDKRIALRTLGALLMDVTDGIERYYVPGKGELDEIELFELWTRFQAGERW